VPAIPTGHWWRPEVPTKFFPGLISVAALAAGLNACTPSGPIPETTPAADGFQLALVGFADLPGWAFDQHAAALPALGRSCDVISRKPAGASLGGGGVAGSAGDWRAPCRALKAVPLGNHQAARSYFERWYRPLRVGAAGPGLFTGYFEPELQGARRKGGRFTVPLYARPQELVTVALGQFRPQWKGQSIAGRVSGGKLRPFASRARLDAGALNGRGLELVWVDSAIDAFFLHVQGSGRVVLRDGSVLRVGFAARNGHPYTAIGRILIARGEIAREDMSMQAIRRWLASHPADAKTLMNKNASFVFFRPLKDTGPVGAQGVALTPERSLAVDRRLIPLGVPIWLDTSDPLDESRPLRRLMVAQDTGSAIRGAVRGDVFWGHGPKAALRAGHMRQHGTYYLLLPKKAQ